MISNVPRNFNEEVYLRLHLDVHEAVTKGVFPTGLHHYKKYGYKENRALEALGPEVYDQDGLRSIHNHDFMYEPCFIKAYNRGVEAAGVDYKFHWRVHTALWAAKLAMSIKGDFIECGVNKGFMSSSIMDYLKWNDLSRIFYLFDTFSGIDEEFVTDEEKELNILSRNQSELYTDNLDGVIENFSEWKNVNIVVGSIPNTLTQVNIEEVAFLHLDMNCSIPEVAAFDFFWGKLGLGGIVLLDDYAYKGYETQKNAMDKIVESKGHFILSLPTGQGLIIKRHS